MYQLSDCKKEFQGWIRADRVRNNKDNNSNYGEIDLGNIHTYYGRYQNWIQLSLINGWELWGGLWLHKLEYYSMG